MLVVFAKGKDFTLWRFLTFLSVCEPFDVLFQDVVGRVGIEQFGTNSLRQGELTL